MSDLSISIYDLTGRLVKTAYKGKTNPGRTTVSFNIDELANSIYIYMIKIDDVRIQKKLIKQ